MDRLTRVNNRQNLLGFMNHKVKHHENDLYLLMMDVDEFKQINDTYGHLAGDEALVKVSGGIKHACGSYLPRPYIARFGGDEFIIVMEADDEKNVEKICSNIRESIAELNKGDEYTLGISIGMAKFKEGQTPKELISEADGKLYEIKKSRKAGAV